jgi:hypothetical protein
MLLKHLRRPILKFHREKSVLALPFRIDKTYAEDLFLKSNGLFHKEIRDLTVKQSYFPFVWTPGIQIETSWNRTFTQNNKGTIQYKELFFVDEKSIQKHLYKDFGYNAQQCANHLARFSLTSMQRCELIDIEKAEEVTTEAIKFAKKESERRVEEKMHMLFYNDPFNIAYNNHDVRSNTLYGYHLPIFVFEYISGDKRCVKVINGYNGKINGSTIYDVPLVAAVSIFASFLCMIIDSIIAVTINPFSFGIPVLPFILSPLLLTGFAIYKNANPVYGQSRSSKMIYKIYDQIVKLLNKLIGST